MSGKPTKIDLDQDTQIDLRCQVHGHLLPNFFGRYISFPIAPLSDIYVIVKRYFHNITETDRYV